MSDPATADTPVSHEIDGRILTGVGATPDQLETVMERHLPPPDEPAAEPEQPAHGQPVPQPPTKTRGQRRFDELTREREDARREAAAAARERDELRARLEALSRPSPIPAAAPVPAPPTSAQPPQPVATRPKPTVDQIGTRYPQYEDFLEDLADWKAEQRLAALNLDQRVAAGIEADRASRTFVESVDTVKTRGRQAYADFDAVLASGPGSQVLLGRDQAQANARVRKLTTLPNSEHVMYAIGKDASVAQRIAAMDDVDFGILLAQMAPSGQVAAPPASTAPPGSAVVPAPYQPVGAGRQTTAVPSSELTRKAGFDFDASGYREKRAKERGLRR